ncbi:hypothetical protein Tco_0142870, partial [Tanacetum coccineum]
MHISKDDYLINTLRFVSAKEATQIYGAVLPECLTSPEMKESKAYNTYLDMLQVHVLQMGSKNLRKLYHLEGQKAPVETKSTRKEKVDITRGKGIKLLSEVALTEEAQMKEVRKKCLRDFHKTHPSSSGTVAKKPQSDDKITPTVTSERTGDKPGVPDVT